MTEADHEPTAQKLIDAEFKRSLLRGISLLRGVDPDEMGDLLSSCGRFDINAGEVLLAPDRKNHCIYVVLSGSLQVHIGSKEAPKSATLLPGACAGEMSLVEEKDASIYVIASENSHLMVISHNLLWQMVDRSHTFSKNLLIVLSERVRSDNEFIASSLGILRKAEHNAVTDALTGLGNRRWMKDMFERELKRLQRNKIPCCVMMLDIDYFKHFNDQYGHIAGDRVLAGVAQALRDHLRPTDLIVRFGGDEFAAMLPGISLEQAHRTSERLLAHLRTLSPGSLPVPITVSIGTAEVLPEDEVDTLLHRADRAMYNAKSAGRNRVATQQPNGSVAPSRSASG
jgi:diguanylate cyclase (GGDEF)-like protein